MLYKSVFSYDVYDWDLRSELKAQRTWLTYYIEEKEALLKPGSILVLAENNFRHLTILH